VEWTIEEAENLEGRRCVFGDPFLLAGARPRPRPANITLSPVQSRAGPCTATVAAGEAQGRVRPRANSCR